MIWRKTDGNPFYALHFLDMLYREGVLLMRSDNCWEWDEERILLDTNVTENVTSILESKLLQLPDQVRTVLQVASFIGHEFSVDTLVLIFFEEQDMFDADYTFSRQPQEVIINRISETLQYVCEVGLVEKLPVCRLYKFAHDKIRHVLYEDLMPDQFERLLLHQRIGTLIWESIKLQVKEEEADDHLIFQAVNNLNLALSVVDYSGDRYELITLNLIAAKRSRVKFALMTAADYLHVALDLLEGDASWCTHHDLCFSLYSTAAEVFSISSHYDESMKLVNELHRRSSSMEQKCVVFDIEMKILSGQGNLKGSLFLGVDVVRKLGVHIPQKITLSSCCREYLRCKMGLGKRSLHSLLSLPVMTNVRIERSLKFIDAVFRNAFYLGDSHKEVYIFMIAKMFYLSLRHGLSSFFAPISFLYWGIIHAAMGKYDVASEACNVAFAAIERFKVDTIRGRATVLSYGIRFWRTELKHHHSEAILHSYHQSMSSGETFFAHMGISGWILTRNHLDKSLSETVSFLKIIVSEMREENAKVSLQIILPFCQLVRTFCSCFNKLRSSLTT
jgi:predicted ATPase